ncbi:MAG: SCO family protein [Gammaproteobacteria bacterium]|nr:SCO family protein [Gammaproteobacteria bacterium]
MTTLATESNSTRRLLGVIVVAITALIVGLWFGLGGWPKKHIETVAATVLNPPQPIADFTLVDHHGRPFNKASLVGQWTFLFFGYTHCPDVCPSTLRVLEQVDRALAEHADGGPGWQVVFVSVDPSRDTPASLAQYVSYFNPRFLGLTGEMRAIQTLTDQLGILHMRVEQEDGNGYLIDHSASVLLVGPDAVLRAIFSAPHTQESIVQDFLEISAAYS